VKEEEVKEDERIEGSEKEERGKTSSLAPGKKR
jgi:hypothetical protein